MLDKPAAGQVLRCMKGMENGAWGNNILPLGLWVLQPAPGVEDTGKDELIGWIVEGFGLVRDDALVPEDRPTRRRGLCLGADYGTQQGDGRAGKETESLHCSNRR